jgi:superfamily I DNA/RNA helicase
VNNLKLVLGGPGCGKTTRMLDIIATEMAAGVPPTAIAYVTFNKDASEKGRAQAAKQFSLDPKRDLPWFRTIHSLAYHCLSVQRDEIMDRRDWAEFSAVVHETITGAYSTEDGAPVSGREIGDTLLRITDYASTTLVTLEEAWANLDEVVDWWRLKRFATALAAYKADTGKMDFTDLLRLYPREGKAIDVQVAVIDEAQDLTAAQWAVVRHAFSGAERVYAAGDDDQAIYHWAGADVQQFLTLSETPEILHYSHRLPRTIHALSQAVASRITHRYRKRFQPSDREGRVEWHQHASGVDFSEGTWFLLARNNYMLRPLEALVRELGLNYTKRSGPAVVPLDVRAMQLWERLRNGKVGDMSAAEYRMLSKALNLPKPQTKESHRYTLATLGYGGDRRPTPPWFEALTGIDAERRDYYLTCLRRGERLTTQPRISIETIHGVKGAEADHVLLMTDMSGRTAKSYRMNADNEHRVFYVGATRAKESLHLVMPQSDQAYNIA